MLALLPVFTMALARILKEQNGTGLISPPALTVASVYKYVPLKVQFLPKKDQIYKKLPSNLRDSNRMNYGG
jgi:hypothetical protein